MPAQPMLVVLVDAPAESERRRIAGRLRVDSKERLQRRRGNPAGGEVRGAELRQVGGRGQQSTARPLVRYVRRRHVAVGALKIRLRLAHSVTWLVSDYPIGHERDLRIATQ